MKLAQVGASRAEHCLRACGWSIGELSAAWRQTHALKGD